MFWRDVAVALVASVILSALQLIVKGVTSDAKFQPFFKAFAAASIPNKILFLVAYTFTVSLYALFAFVILSVPFVIALALLGLQNDRWAETVGSWGLIGVAYVIAVRSSFARDMIRWFVDYPGWYWWRGPTATAARSNAKPRQPRFNWAQSNPGMTILLVFGLVGLIVVVGLKWSAKHANLPPATIVYGPNGTKLSFPGNANVAVISDAMTKQFGTGTLESVGDGYIWTLKPAPILNPLRRRQNEASPQP
jgi:hypothetical protein